VGGGFVCLVGFRERVAADSRRTAGAVGAWRLLDGRRAATEAGSRRGAWSTSRRRDCYCAWLTERR
jgi:hypothetical protein